MAAGIAAVSTGAIFARLADAHPIVIAAYRVGIAAALLCPWALWKTRAELVAARPGTLAMAALSGGFLALHFATWISSLSLTSVANSVVLVNTNPLWVALLTPLFTRDTISFRAKLGIAASIAGAVVIGAGDFHTDPDTLLGDGLAILGSICAAIYLLIGRRLRASLSLMAYILICYGGAALVLWSMVYFLRLPVSGFSPATWGAFMGMALLSQLAGHSCYNWALKWVSANAVAVSLLGEPVGASILAYFLFGEALGISTVAGGALILSGIYLSASGSAPGGQGG
jgi:drug/metabolite transporter (DMT)-like permease